MPEQQDVIENSKRVDSDVLVKSANGAEFTSSTLTSTNSSANVSPVGSSQTRNAILSRIRATKSNPGDIADEYAALPRDYMRKGVLDLDARLDLFEERLREYDAGVYRVESGSISEAVAKILEERGMRRIAIPGETPQHWLPEKFEFTSADHLTAVDLNTFDGVLSGCTVAIALTGSIVLQNAPAQGPRQLSLVPDYHLCIIYVDQVVETVSEAFERLEATSTLPTTFISGPSATADIEMTRIKGVHGPRFLDVILAI